LTYFVQFICALGKKDVPLQPNSVNTLFINNILWL